MSPFFIDTDDAFRENMVMHPFNLFVLTYGQ